ncbi:hypothetical protein A9Q81_10335 [Gammaproteobacteria bacterium 42_54_T18]|nr:hypothetical protein A9Q81_10335 [Gammaproteobacteria bacterium 42_54_T18]
MKHLYISSTWVNGLLKGFAALGLDLNVIIKDLPGFEQCQFQEDQRVELSTARQLWHRATQISKDPLLGYTLGLSQDYRVIGVLAPVLWHSPTVQEALNNIIRFQKLISDSGSYRATYIRDAESNLIYLDYEYVPVYNIVPVNPQQVLAVVTGTIGIIQAISNNCVSPISLRVPGQLPTKTLSKHFNCTVTSGAENFIIRFPCTHLKEKLKGHDPHLYEINRTYADELLRANNEGQTLIDTVKDLIRQLGYRAATLDDIDEKIGIQPRSLQRHLSEQGTSFRLLKEEVLKEQAVKMLVFEKIDIETITQLLGYSEPSAFHRAFKGWFGKTPQQWALLGDNSVLLHPVKSERRIVE